MSDGKNNIDIAKDNAEIVQKQSEKTNLTNAKILHINSETDGLNFDGIIANLLQYVNMADALSHVEKTVEYVVQIPIKHQDAYQSGDVFMNQNLKTGVMWPTLYKKLDSGKRQFVGNLPVKEEEIVHGNPFESIAVSYHNIYMQQQINNLAEIMEQTCKAVERIEQGQKDDRIGLLNAGRYQILLSLHSSSENKAAGIEQGRSNLLIAQNQLLQTLKTLVANFDPIPEQKLKIFLLELKHSGYLQQKDKEFSNIQEYYSLFLQATQMIASSYAIFGELEAAQNIFDIAEQNIKQIDFSPLNTLQYIHNTNNDMLYYHAAEYVEAERVNCMEESQEYDLIDIEVSGEKLLEVLSNDRTKKVPEAEFEQR